MIIIEKHIQGKLSDEACEDVIIMNDHFAGVIDGATDKAGIPINGMTGGKFIALAVATFMANAERTMDFNAWVRGVAGFIDSQLREHRWPETVQRPAASAVVYSSHHREVWRVGDCNFRIIPENARGITFPGMKLVDVQNAEKRSQAVRSAILEGASIGFLMKDDPGREIIMPFLKEQYRHANNATDPLGYPVFNGDNIPEALLEKPIKVPPRAYVILTSDGFTDIRDSLEATMEAQEKLYLEDPLMIGINGGQPCVKGLRDLNGIHDDRAYLSLRS